mgnify:CR=1 FL=1|jgi:hypothetical protein|tara:strand:+ start:1393 stop:2142 length:750 start_codon:yes stop_codon:yes gene_type:complete
MKYIKFSCHKDLLEEKIIQPIPAKQNIPEWYKKIEKYFSQDKHDRTIKSCVPVLDSITCGYLLRMPQDMQMQYNIWVEPRKKYCTRISFSAPPHQDSLNLGIQCDAEDHPNQQVGGPDSFYSKKHRGMGVPKIINPFVIKTPPGYSCMFIPPMHREMDYFHILPGIVDTDTFKLPINFPFIMNTDKYKTIDTIIKIGTPYVQVIPFKRDSWKMEIKAQEENENEKNTFLHKLRMVDAYKLKWWDKKSYK